MKKLVMCVVLLLGVFAAYRWHAQSSASCDNMMAFDRVWLDHMPTSDKDTTNAFAASSAHPIGVFDEGSSWRGNFELFEYQYSGKEMLAVFPQTGERETIKVRARRCTAAQCDPSLADYCLELDGGSRGVKKYYSRKGWEIDKAGDAKSVELRIDEVRRSSVPR